MNRYLPLFIPLLILLLTAGTCNGPANKPPSLGITPPSASVNAGDGPLSLIATLSNTSGDVSWTLSPTLGTLSSTTGLQISYTPPAKLTTQTEVTLTASVGSLSAKATITVNLAGAGQVITVSGKVLNFATSKPGAFLPVLVNGQKTATDESGTFSVANVLTPYDLVVVFPEDEEALIYQGLTRPDPTVFDYYVRNDDPQESAVTYSFTNFDTSPAPPDPSYAVDYIACASASSNADMTRCSGDNINGLIGATPYPFTVTWDGASSIRANFYAWQMIRNLTDSGFITTDVRRFARTENVPLTSGQAASVNFDFQPVTTTSISGNISVPSGYTLTTRELYFTAGGQFLSVLSSESSEAGVPPSFSWPAPVVTGLELGFYAIAKKGDASVSGYLNNVVPGTIGLTLPAPPELSQPATAATGVDHTTVFSWTPFDEGIYTFRASPETEDPLSLYIYTAQTQATLPDLSSLGYSLPKGVEYRWWVDADAPVLDTNELTSGVDIYSKSEGYYASSEERTFTTTP